MTFVELSKITTYKIEDCKFLTTKSIITESLNKPGYMLHAPAAEPLVVEFGSFPAPPA
jgi:hypothetical protein